MPRGKHLVRRTPGGFRPIGTPKEPIIPPPQPADSERSARPPAYWGKRTKSEQRD
jgi:hypothetical protein